MVKFITRTICMALVAVLCVGSLNAQNARTANGPIKSQAISLSAFKNVQPTPPAPKGMVKVTLEAHDVWGDGSGYHMLLDATATQYGVGFPATGNPWASCPVPSNLYNWTTHKIPENATATCSSHSTFVVNGSVTIYIPAGTYDFCFANCEAPYDYWFPSDYGNITPRQDNYTFQDGKAYHFLALVIGSNDGINLTITDDTPTDDCPAVTNLQAEVQGTNVKLTWTAASGSPTGYKVTDGTTPLGTVTATEYVATNLTVGDHTLGVEAIYDDGCIPVKVTTTVTIKIGNPIKNLNGNCNDGTLTLTWDAPDAKGTRAEYWLTYSSDDINPDSGIGLTGGGDIMSAARFTAADLAAKGVETGHTITKLQIVMSKAGGGVSNLKLKVWEGGTSVSNPGNLVVDQAIDLSLINESAWSTIELATPFEIDATKELRIGYGLSHTSATAYPLLYDFGPHVQDKSDLLYAGAWTSLYNELGGAPYYCDFSACIKAGILGDVNVPEVTRYDIYQDDVLFGTVNAPATTFTKTGVEGKHNYCVVAIYDNGAQSVKVCKEIGCGDVPACNKVTGAKAEIAECKTATITWTAVTGAVGYEVTREGNTVTVTAPTHTEEAEFEDGKTYTWEIVTVCAENKSEAVSVTANCGEGINELSNSIAIFPNPSNSTVNIQATDFAKVEVYNTVGQLIETRTVNIVDVSTYNTGIYFFKVYDNNNNSVTKRVMVTK
jgi:hypothetical protein